jgi:hypothetical protein
MAPRLATTRLRETSGLVATTGEPHGFATHTTTRTNICAIAIAGAYAA